MVLFPKIKKICIPTDVFFRNFLRFSRATFVILSSDWFHGTKNLLVAAVWRCSLNQLLWNICENFKETIYHEAQKQRVFLGTCLEFFWTAILIFPGDCICGTENHNMTVSPDNFRSNRLEMFLKSYALKNSREFPGQGTFRTAFLRFESIRPEV